MANTKKIALSIMTATACAMIEALPINCEAIMANIALRATAHLKREATITAEATMTAEEDMATVEAVIDSNLLYCFNSYVPFACLR